MKYLIIVLLVLPALLMSLLPAGEKEKSPGKEITPSEEDVAPVSSSTNVAVLELFTSQGCSSCPSADALLAELDADLDHVIALSFHVDYWNYLGWEDPFSSKYFSARQSDYSGALQARTYTPQLVVNGRKEMIGSRTGEVKQAVKTALREGLQTSLAFTTEVSGRKVTVNFTLADVPAGYRVTALLAQPEATSAIGRGENRGRTLHHVNVVRAMEHTPAAATGELLLTAPEDFDPAGGEIILLLQNKQTQEIVGAAKGLNIQ